ncbi:MAG: sulfite exporter TauE/SafE family protein [Nitratireductor sp.]
MACVIAASVVQFGLGMGFGLTAAPLLALIDSQLVPASTLFIGFASSAWGAWGERSEIVWGEVWLAACGRAIGVVVAIGVLSLLTSRDTFTLVFGIMIAIAVLMSIAGWRIPLTRKSLLAMAILSGAMGTITSVGAPPLAIVYQDRPSRAARPTLAAFFAIGCAMSLAGLYASGWAGQSDFLLALFMVPGMVVGALIASRLRDRFDRRYRPALLAISGAAAIILIFRALL